MVGPFIVLPVLVDVPITIVPAEPKLVQTFIEPDKTLLPIIMSLVEDEPW